MTRCAIDFFRQPQRFSQRWQRARGDAIHRVSPFREFHGWFSQSLTRWPVHLGDRHLLQDHEPELHHSRGRNPQACRSTLGDPLELLLSPGVRRRPETGRRQIRRRHRTSRALGCAPDQLTTLSRGRVRLLVGQSPTEGPTVLGSCRTRRLSAVGLFRERTWL